MSKKTLKFACKEKDEYLFELFLKYKNAKQLEMKLRDDYEHIDNQIKDLVSKREKKADALKDIETDLFRVTEEMNAGICEDFVEKELKSDNNE